MGERAQCLLLACRLCGVCSVYRVSHSADLVSVSVNTAVYGVSCVHKKSGYQEPIEYPVVKQTGDAAQRILARPPKRKEPLSAALVRKVISRLERGSLANIQVATLFNLGFFGFLRWDDLHRLTVGSLHFEESHVAIFLKKQKNNQLCEGSWVFIARCCAPSCPVTIVEKFTMFGNHSKTSSLFWRVLNTKRGVCLRKELMS